MTYKVYGHGQNQPKTLDELTRRIEKAWRELDQKMLQRAVHQMKLRMAEVVWKKGEKLKNFTSLPDLQCFPPLRRRLFSRRFLVVVGRKASCPLLQLGRHHDLVGRGRGAIYIAF